MTNRDRRERTPLPRVLCALAALAAASGCSLGGRPAPPVNTGLNALANQAGERTPDGETMVRPAPGFETPTATNTLDSPLDTSLEALIRQSTQDLAQAAELDAGSVQPGGEFGTDTDPETITQAEPGSAPGSEPGSEPGSSLRARPLDGQLRAMSAAAIGPLVATPGQRRAADAIAQRAPMMETQLLMPAITEAAGESIENQVAELAEELASLLREQAAGSADPARSYLAMATLEAIRPGILVELSADGGGELASVLSPNEVEAVRTARALVAGLVDEESEPSDPDDLADHLDHVSQQLRPHTSIAIEEASLCRRVVGFGQYTSYSSDAFVAGRPVRAILYVELDRFAHRKVGSRDQTFDGDRWAVEVGQEMSLFVDREIRPVWHRPEQRVVSTSRRKIRDLFLTDQLTLPPTLGVGQYTLRVRVRDLITEAVDERLIPIRIVADARSARAAG